MKKNNMRNLIVYLSFLLLIAPLSGQEVTVRDIIKGRIEKGKIEKIISADSVVLYSQEVLPSFYEKNDYYPAWFEKENYRDFFSNIEDSYNEGLLPEDYHLSRIKRIINEIRETKSREKMADLDMLITDAILLYTTHLIIGKVDQSVIAPGWDVPPNKLPKNGGKLLMEALAAKDLTAAINSLKPKNFFYKGVREYLKKYREIASKGGWPRIPEGETIKLGVKDERVPLIRKYLAITGDLSEANLANDDEVFGVNLEKAVKNFQRRHNYTADGVVGKTTLKAMNVPVEKRIEQMRITLERARWVFHQLPEDFLIVNIAGFFIKRVTNGKETFHSRVIVGKQYHETPIFRAKMKYIDLNPTWTVPYSIATKEMLPKLKKNPNYLKTRNMVILDRAGNKLNPATIDFSKLNARNFPYIIRQNAGPRNALGQVKFMFPNKYSVYVHDTPSRYLFEREERAFSHGCIRLEKKWELFMSLVNEPDVWNMEKINEVLKTHKTKRIVLKNPIDILLLYWTAGLDINNGELQFFEDVYNRDAPVIKELDKPYIFKKVK